MSNSDKLRLDLLPPTPDFFTFGPIKLTEDVTSESVRTGTGSSRVVEDHCTTTSVTPSSSEKCDCPRHALATYVNKEEKRVARLKAALYLASLLSVTFSRTRQLQQAFAILRSRTMMFPRAAYAASIEKANHRALKTMAVMRWHRRLTDLTITSLNDQLLVSETQREECKHQLARSQLCVKALSREVVRLKGENQKLRADRQDERDQIWTLWKGELRQSKKEMDKLIDAVKPLVDIVSHIETDKAAKAPLLELTGTQFFEKLKRHRATA